MPPAEREIRQATAAFDAAKKAGVQVWLLPCQLVLAMYMLRADSVLDGSAVHTSWGLLHAPDCPVEQQVELNLKLGPAMHVAHMQHIVFSGLEDTRPDTEGKLTPPDGKYPVRSS